MPVANRLQSLGDASVWLEFTPLASRHNAVNLGQGFPNWAPPPFLQDAVQSLVSSPVNNQYAHAKGQPNLRKAIASQYSPRLGRELHADQHIMATVGASEALFLICMSYINPGDEVIVLEPAFDIYIGTIALAGGKTVYVPLGRKEGAISHSSEFYLDFAALKKHLTAKTRMIIINSPHNPTGKLFTREEYEELERLLRAFPDVIIVADEVYEHLVYENKTHLPLASVGQLFEKTLSVYSAGKTFSCTGWKVGWVCGPAKLIDPLFLTQQFVVFSFSTLLQEAIALAFKAAEQPYEGHPSYYHWLKQHYQEKRRFLCESLKKAGIVPIVPEGSFFILGDFSAYPGINTDKPPEAVLEALRSGKLKVDTGTLTARDYNFCRHLTVSKQVTAIPNTAFFCAHHRHLGDRWARFAFCKTEDLLEEAARRL